MAMKTDDVMGYWAIKSWMQTYDDGRVMHPMGETLTGLIHYGKTQMYCLIARKGRSHFNTGGQWNAENKEKAAAYDSLMSYNGTYAIVGNEIIHHVETSLFPNWEGGTQRRQARFVNGQLHLVARLEDGTPQARTATLIWERAAD